MAHMLSLLSNVEDIQPIHVALPNGSEIMAFKRGTINLDSKLRLNNVLYVPGLNCNLISIAQLIEDNICEVIFIKKLCVIQDLTTRSPIGVGEPKRGVYYPQQAAPDRVQVNQAITYDTWHCRLGHPSSQALSYIFSNVRSKHKNKSDLCDVCLRAKLTRMSFVLSENKAVDCFDLVQCDIWGPYRISHFVEPNIS